MTDGQVVDGQVGGSCVGDIEGAAVGGLEDG